MTTRTTLIASLPLLAVVLTGCGSGTPEATTTAAPPASVQSAAAPPATSLDELLDRVQAALTSGDVAALEALFHLAEDVHVSTRMGIRTSAEDLSRPGERSLEPTEVDDDYLAERAEWGRHIDPQPLGLILVENNITHVLPDGGTMTEGSRATWAYAEIDGAFHLLAEDLLPEARAELQRSFDSDEVARELASMVEEPLLDSGQPLPEGGGEPGKVLLAYLAALQGESLADLVPFRPFLQNFVQAFEIDGEVIRPAPSAEEQAETLRVFRQGALRQARVSGGWLGNEAAVVKVEGIVGDNWPSVAYYLMEKEDGRWTVGPDRSLHD
jgi:hypothetical protein